MIPRCPVSSYFFLGKPTWKYNDWWGMSYPGRSPFHRDHGKWLIRLRQYFLHFLWFYLWCEGYGTLYPVDHFSRGWLSLMYNFPSPREVHTPEEFRLFDPVGGVVSCAFLHNGTCTAWVRIWLMRRAAEILHVPQLYYKKIITAGLAEHASFIQGWLSEQAYRNMSMNALKLGLVVLQ